MTKYKQLENKVVQYLVYEENFLYPSFLSIFVEMICYIIRYSTTFGQRKRIDTINRGSENQ